MRTPHLSVTTSGPDPNTPRRREPSGILRVVGILLTALGLVAAGSAALADGTETLGTPSITITDGSGVAAGGTGMVDQPGTITVDVPAGATINQVLLYWEGMSSTEVPGDGTIVIEGTEVTGTLIGGPTFFFGDHYPSAFRADITDLGLVTDGTNSLTVSGLDFSAISDGAGVLVIYDDGVESEIGLVDGLDLAFAGFKPPRQSTVPQTFTFAAEDVDRVGDLTMFFSSVAGQDLPGERPTVIEVSIDGVVTQSFESLLASNDGLEWDTLVVGVDIPAGTTAVTVQALSQDPNGENTPASFTWTMAALTVPVTPPPPPPPPGGGEGCTPGYWKQPHHFDSWVTYEPVDDYEVVFGIDADFDAETLLEVLRQGGGKDKALGRHAVAALLNAESDVSFAYTADEVIALVQDAYATGDFNSAKSLLEAENEEGCPLN